MMAIPDSANKTAGLTLGTSVAHQILALRSHDGFDAPSNFTPGTALSNWQPTPPGNLPALLPKWGDVTPWALHSADQFAPDPLPPLNGTQYADAFNEVHIFGADNAETADRDHNGIFDRTPDQTQIAKFWANGPGTATTPGAWNHVASIVSQSQGLTL